MNEPTYRLEGFEGPLDVLLTLIERHKIDIYNIEISLLLEQYMKWMDDARERNLDITADFLEMASRLVYIKSCSLLPKTEDEEEDPKWLLEQMLTKIPLFSFSKFAYNVSTYEKLRTQTSLPLNLSTNYNSTNSSASSGTQEVSYLMSSRRSCSAFPHFYRGLREDSDELRPHFR